MSSSNGPPSHMTLAFEYRISSVQYTDESGIRMFGIQMVIADLKKKNLNVKLQGNHKHKLCCEQEVTTSYLVSN